MAAKRKKLPRKLVYRRPWLYPKQEEALFTCKDVNGEPARYAFCEASTKAGKTSACIAWLFEQGILNGKPGRGFWWVAPVYGQAKIAFRRMKLGLVPTMYAANETEMSIRIPNGAVFYFKSAEKPDNLYGDDVYAAVLDEASRMREEAWHAMRSTLTATRGPARCIGNVKGRKNWFYRLCRMAEAGSPGMAYAKLNAYDAVAGGVLDGAEIEDAKKLLPENVFKELYLAEASEDDGSPFGSGHIQACLGPLSEARPVAIGIDLAKHVDWTVVIGIDAKGRVCGFERWQKTPWLETTERIRKMVRSVPAYADSTGVGDPIVESLQTTCYGVVGYNFTPQSKQRLMEGLALAIQSREITFPDGPIRAELELFEYVLTRTGVRYSAPEGYHDDCVMALALAVAKWREVTLGGGAAPVGIPRISPWMGEPGTEGDE